MHRTLAVRVDTLCLKRPFTISRGTRSEARVVVVEIEEAGVVGRGECVPYRHNGETPASVVEAILRLENAVAEGLDRQTLQTLAPPGAARNALDCALWDLEAKRSGRRAWQMADLPAPADIVTAFTISLDTPDRMAKAAGAAADLPVLKLKLTGEGDLDRVAAVRTAAPDSRIIVDANEAWSIEDLASLPRRLAELGVAMIEQPVPAQADAVLASYDGPIPLCADESCHDRADLDRVAGRYAMINIKLDKAGGLTEAIALAAAARARGLGVMVGCMLGSSLAMAPAMLVAQGADIVDLDGPLWLADDRCPPLEIRRGRMSPPAASLWG